MESNQELIQRDIADQGGSREAESEYVSAARVSNKHGEADTADKVVRDGPQCWIVVLLVTMEMRL